MLFLARLRTRRRDAEDLARGALAARGSPKDLKKQIRDLGEGRP